TILLSISSLPPWQILYALRKYCVYTILSLEVATEIAGEYFVIPETPVTKSVSCMTSPVLTTYLYIFRNPSRSERKIIFPSWSKEGLRLSAPGKTSIWPDLPVAMFRTAIFIVHLPCVIFPLSILSLSVAYVRWVPSALKFAWISENLSLVSCVTLLVLRS